MSSPSPSEKARVSATENEDSKFTTDNQVGETDDVAPPDPKIEARVLRKLDIFLSPVLFIVYLSCFIDRANIGMP